MSKYGRALHRARKRHQVRRITKWFAIKIVEETLYQMTVFGQFPTAENVMRGVRNPKYVAETLLPERLRA